MIVNSLVLLGNKWERRTRNCPVLITGRRLLASGRFLVAFKSPAFTSLLLTLRGYYTNWPKFGLTQSSEGLCLISHQNVYQDLYRVMKIKPGILRVISVYCAVAYHKIWPMYLYDDLCHVLASLQEVMIEPAKFGTQHQERSCIHLKDIEMSSTQ